MCWETGAQGDVGGYAGGPEAVERVDFSDVVVDVEAFGEVAQLVLVAAAGGVHGLFVEGGVTYAVDDAGAGEVGGVVERLEDVDGRRPGSCGRACERRAGRMDR